MISKSTISRWNQEMARLRVCESLNIDKETRFFTYAVTLWILYSTIYCISAMGTLRAGHLYSTYS